MIATARTAAERGSFSRIRQMAHICIQSNTWPTRICPSPKQHIDRFRHFAGLTAVINHTGTQTMHGTTTGYMEFRIR